MLFLSSPFSGQMRDFWENVTTQILIITIVLAKIFMLALEFIIVSLDIFSADILGVKKK